MDLVAVDSPAVSHEEEPAVVSVVQVRDRPRHVGLAEERALVDQVVLDTVEAIPAVKDALVDLAAAVLEAVTTARATDHQNPAAQPVADEQDSLPEQEPVA